MAHFFENRYIFVLASVLLIAWYFMYSISMDRPNYWYPALVFGALIPMSGDFKPGLIMNTLFVLIAAYYCPFGKHEWLALFIGVFLFVQYFFRGKEPVYIYAATLSLAAWQITFGIARDIPNYFALVPLAAVFVVSYRERLTLNLFISICAFILWFHQILQYSKLYGYTYGIITTTVIQSSIGIVLFLVGLFHLDRDRTLADVYKVFGFVTVLGGAYVLSFKSHIKTGHTGNSKLFLSADLALLLIALVLFFSFGDKKYFSEKPRMFLLTGISAAIPANLFVLVYQQQVTASTVVMNLLIAVISVFYGVELQNKKYLIRDTNFYFVHSNAVHCFWELKEKSWFYRWRPFDDNRRRREKQEGE